MASYSHALRALVACLIAAASTTRAFNLPRLGGPARPAAPSSSDSSPAVLQQELQQQLPVPTLDYLGVPSNGISDYIGNTSHLAGSGDWNPNAENDANRFRFIAPSKGAQLATRFALWRQWPWKKIAGRVVLSAKVGGELSLDPPQSGGFLSSFGKAPAYSNIETLAELRQMLQFGAYDPRVTAIFIELDRLACGYAKLIELKREMKFFRESGKKIYVYMSTGSEKELFVALGADEIYIPPDGGLDLRGFAASASFFRGVFEKLGLEPQVQRIGKYKSFGDTFNRTEISDAQREVTSSLLMEASSFWAQSVAQSVNKTTAEVLQLWADSGIKDAFDYRALGYVTGICYLDQVEERIIQDISAQLNVTTSTSSSKKLDDESTQDIVVSGATVADSNSADEKLKDFDLAAYFVEHPRRSVVNVTSLSNSETRAVQRAASRGQKADPTAAASTSTSSYSSETTSTSTSTSSVSTTASDSDEPSWLQKAIAFPADSGFSTGRPGIFAGPQYSVGPDGKRRNSKKPRFFPAGLYLRKMRKGTKILSGLRVREVSYGPRVAVINAIGGINSGSSGNGAMGRSLGSDTLISQVRMAKADPGIKAVVIRVDSPGGSALASDLMWREIRELAKEKPVVASMVDVAASGGYYIAMACDTILAEELTVTGSIGVVTAKFSQSELNSRIGLNVSTISRGRYAEVLSTSRGFTDDEDRYFADGAQRAYTSFITKAALSRSLPLPSLAAVAQGRVWTGRQAKERGLVDSLGGLDMAVHTAACLGGLVKGNDKGDVNGQGNDQGDEGGRGKGPMVYSIETLRDRTPPKLPFPLSLINGIAGLAGIDTAAGSLASLGGIGGVASSSMGTRSGLSGGFSGVGGGSADALYLADDVIAHCGLASEDTLGVPAMLRGTGLGPLASRAVLGSVGGGVLGRLLEMAAAAGGATTGASGVNAVSTVGLSGREEVNRAGLGGALLDWLDEAL